MHFKGCTCDSPEGNLCRRCENEVKDAMMDGQQLADPWQGFGARKDGQWSINAGPSGTVAEGYMYV